MLKKTLFKPAESKIIILSQFVIHVDDYFVNICIL